MYDKHHFNLFSTRFEQIFKEYDQLSASSLIWVVHKTWFRCMILRNHRKWIKSLQNFLDNYKPFKYYSGDNMNHGITYQPLLIEHNGYYKAKFVWFIDRKDLQNTYGWVDIQCDGNYYSRTMNINEFRLHVNPREGGEVLKFDPIKLSIDDQWNAHLLETIYSFKEKQENETKVNKDIPRKVLSKKRPSKKRQSKIEEADYTILKK